MAQITCTRKFHTLQYMFFVRNTKLNETFSANVPIGEGLYVTNSDVIKWDSIDNVINFDMISDVNISNMSTYRYIGLSNYLRVLRKHELMSL